MQKTDYLSIVKVEGICGGKAIIEGTRITVRHIVVMVKAGDSTDEILQFYPHLKPVQINDAIRYYHNHWDEIETEIKENRIENVIKKHGAVMDEKGIVRFPSSTFFQTCDPNSTGNTLKRGCILQ